jgi:nucleotide sugar dehydrogenase
MAHWPGCGVGGHCIAVDPYYLIKKASQHGFDHKFLKLAREINNGMPHYAVKKLQLALNEVELPIKKTKIALLGLSYKPDIGDLRDSPAFDIKKQLIKLGADLQIYDPFVNGGFSSLQEAIKDVSAVLVATGHTEFVEGLPKLLPKSAIKVVIDGRNCLDKDKMSSLGVIYKGIGR